MDRIANSRDLVAELRALADTVEATVQPSRVDIAHKLASLSRRVIASTSRVSYHDPEADRRRAVKEFGNFMGARTKADDATFDCGVQLNLMEKLWASIMEYTPTSQTVNPEAANSYQGVSSKLITARRSQGELESSLAIIRGYLDTIYKNMSSRGVFKRP